MSAQIGGHAHIYIQSMSLHGETDSFVITLYLLICIYIHIKVAVYACVYAFNFFIYRFF